MLNVADVDRHVVLCWRVFLGVVIFCGHVRDHRGFLRTCFRFTCRHFRRQSWHCDPRCSFVVKTTCLAGHIDNGIGLKCLRPLLGQRQSLGKVLQWSLLLSRTRLNESYHDEWVGGHTNIVDSENTTVTIGKGHFCQSRIVAFPFVSMLMRFRTRVRRSPRSLRDGDVFARSVTSMPAAFAAWTMSLWGKRLSTW